MLCLSLCPWLESVGSSPHGDIPHTEATLPEPGLRFSAPQRCTDAEWCSVTYFSFSTRKVSSSVLTRVYRLPGGSHISPHQPPAPQRYSPACRSNNRERSHSDQKMTTKYRENVPVHRSRTLGIHARGVSRLVMCAGRGKRSAITCGPRVGFAHRLASRAPMMILRKTIRRKCLS